MIARCRSFMFARTSRLVATLETIAEIAADRISGSTSVPATRTVGAAGSVTMSSGIAAVARATADAPTDAVVTHRTEGGAVVVEVRWEAPLGVTTWPLVARATVLEER